MLALNDQCITLTGLTDKTDGSFVNDATATVTLQKYGVDVTGETWPLAMPYVAASNGDYRAIIQSDIDLSAGDNVTITVTVSAPGGGNASFVQTERVSARGFSGG
ncbi:MAG: hypothetical protein AB9Q22_10295 [Candidatus Reddybacter sp.]